MKPFEVSNSISARRGHILTFFFMRLKFLYDINLAIPSLFLLNKWAKVYNKSGDIIVSPLFFCQIDALG